MRIMDNKLSRVRDGKLPELSEQDCENQRRLLDTVLGPALGDIFALDHGDLALSNIIVDSEYNISG